MAEASLHQLHVRALPDQRRGLEVPEVIFPYAAPGPGTVIGDLLWFPAGEPRSLLPSLDALEGYCPEASEQHYVRVRREVQAGDGFLARPALDREQLIPLPRLGRLLPT